MPNDVLQWNNVLIVFDYVLEKENPVWEAKSAKPSKKRPPVGCAEVIFSRWPGGWLESEWERDMRAK